MQGSSERGDEAHPLYVEFPSERQCSRAIPQQFFNNLINYRRSSLELYLVRIHVTIKRQG